MQQRGAQLVDVVRRDAGRHADGDARRAVGQQVREVGRQDHRLLLARRRSSARKSTVSSSMPSSSVGRDLRHARFGVALGGGVIAVDVAEVALAVDQRIAHGEILRQAHQRVVDRLVAVRVVVAHRRRRRSWRTCRNPPSGSRLQLAHGVEDAPVHRLEAVAHVGQRPVHDGGQRIGQIALFQRILEADGLDGTGLAGNRRGAHGCWLPSRGAQPQVPQRHKSRKHTANARGANRISALFTAPCAPARGRDSCGVRFSCCAYEGLVHVLRGRTCRSATAAM